MNSLEFNWFVHSPLQTRFTDGVGYTKWPTINIFINELCMKRTSLIVCNVDTPLL